MQRSAEPGRKKAYAQDLRWRVVYQKIALNLSFERIGRNLNISASTAQRVYKLFENTGAVDPSKQPPRERCRSLDEHEELYIVSTI
jgi:transposase